MTLIYSPLVLECNVLNVTMCAISVSNGLAFFSYLPAFLSSRLYMAPLAEVIEYTALTLLLTVLLETKHLLLQNKETA